MPGPPPHGVRNRRWTSRCRTDEAAYDPRASQIALGRYDPLVAAHDHMDRDEGTVRYPQGLRKPVDTTCPGMVTGRSQANIRERDLVTT